MQNMKSNLRLSEDHEAIAVEGAVDKSPNRMVPLAGSGLKTEGNPKMNLIVIMPICSYKSGMCLP